MQAVNVLEKGIILSGGILLMLSSTIVIHLCCKHFLYAVSDYIVSGFWILSIIPLLAYMLYFQNRGKISFGDIGLRKEGITKSILLGAGFGIVIGLLDMAILLSLGFSIPRIHPRLIGLYVIRSVLIAPIYEEILVRGLFWSAIDFLLEWKRFRWKDITVIILSSLVFLFLHLDRDPVLLFTSFLLVSFAYSILYYKTRNLISPILAHSSLNLLHIFFRF